MNYLFPVREEDCVKHYRIRQLDQGGYFIARRRPFSTLQDLITHYTNDADGLCVQLTQPCVKCDAPQTSTFTYGTLRIVDRFTYAWIRVSDAFFADDQWEIDRRSILFIKQIGAGQFGEVGFGVSSSRYKHPGREQHAFPRTRPSRACPSFPRGRNGRRIEVVAVVVPLQLVHVTSTRSSVRRAVVGNE
ncbi:SH2 domain protein [Ancylostoma ceylanicum]|uniref:SH2 domain protein n=1 Tax=Ancylostoma ceylanicum TaxID=53326 RepID=A0A0D6LSB8_9BILA|nr:SH2 domain protein [Ancylostoma ceylanicum]